MNGRRAAETPPYRTRLTGQLARLWRRRPTRAAASPVRAAGRLSQRVADQEPGKGRGAEDGERHRDHPVAACGSARCAPPCRRAARLVGLRRSRFDRGHSLLFRHVGCHCRFAEGPPCMACTVVASSASVRSPPWYQRLSSTPTRIAETKMVTTKAAKPKASARFRVRCCATIGPERWSATASAWRIAFCNPGFLAGPTYGRR